MRVQINKGRHIEMLECIAHSALHCTHYPLRSTDIAQSFLKRSYRDLASLLWTEVVELVGKVLDLSCLPEADKHSVQRQVLFRRRPSLRYFVVGGRVLLVLGKNHFSDHNRLGRSERRSYERSYRSPLDNNHSTMFHDR